MTIDIERLIEKIDEDKSGKIEFDEASRRATIRIGPRVMIAQ